MRRSKIKKLKASRAVMIVAAVASLNFLGVSYASWNYSADVTTMVSTGKIKPCFAKNYVINTNKGSGNLSVNFDEENIMRVNGTIEGEFDGDISYFVENKGTIPIKVKKALSGGGYEEATDSLRVSLNQSLEEIKPKGQKQGFEIPSSFHIENRGDNVDGIFDFELRIPFSQFNQ